MSDAKTPEPLGHTRGCGIWSVDEDHCPGDCTCGLEYRKALSSEQALHNAWRKRAEEAETDLASQRERVAALEALLREYGRHAEGCSAAHGDKYRCRCGWREESAVLARPDAGE